MPQRADTDDGRNAAARAVKKRYEAPRLIRYGDVAHLTRAVGPGGPKKDSPTTSKSRTR